MKEETLKLIDQFKGGDVEAGGVLISLDEALVHTIFERHYKSNDSAREDFLQEGRLGLLEAFKRYDPSKDEQFGYYKSIWVRKRMNMLFKKEYKFSKRKQAQAELNLISRETTQIQGVKHDIEFILDYTNVSDIMRKKDHKRLVNAAMQLKRLKDDSIYKKLNGREKKMGKKLV